MCTCNTNEEARVPTLRDIIAAQNQEKQIRTDTAQQRREYAIARIKHAANLAYVCVLALNKGESTGEEVAAVIDDDLLGTLRDAQESLESIEVQS